jgi:hypothetical protein
MLVTKRKEAAPNTFRDLRSIVELLHGGVAWICNSGTVFSELELCQTHPKNTQQNSATSTCTNRVPLHIFSQEAHNLHYSSSRVLLPHYSSKASI